MPRRWSRSWRPAAEFDRVNVGGLENVLCGGRRGRRRRALVYVSSFIALGPDREAARRRRSTRRRRARASAPGSTTTSAPRRSPTAGRAQAIAAGAPLVVVYPGVIYGPGRADRGQHRGAPSARPALHRRLPALLGGPERRWNYVLRRRRRGRHRRRRSSARRPAAATCSAARTSRRRRLLRAGRASSPACRCRSAALPDGLAKAIGRLMRALVAPASAARRKLTPDLVEIYRHDWALPTPTPPARELGYRAALAAQGLAETLAWLERPARGAAGRTREQLPLPRARRALSWPASCCASSSTWASAASPSRCAARPAGGARLRARRGARSTLFLLPRLGGRQALARGGDAARPRARRSCSTRWRCCCSSSSSAGGSRSRRRCGASSPSATAWPRSSAWRSAARKLPWNPRKSWAGSLAYVLFGTARRGGPAAVDGARALRAGVRLAAAFADRAARRARSSRCRRGSTTTSACRWSPGCSCSASCSPRGTGRRCSPIRPAARGWRSARRSTPRSAAARLRHPRRRPSRAPSSGWLLGTLIWACARLAAASCCCSPSSSSAPPAPSSATRARRRRSSRRRRAAGAAPGTRSPRPRCRRLAAIFAATTEHPLVFALAFAGAFATAAADTASSEIGKLWGRRTFLITTLRPVPRGTEGAVSLEGTLAGVAASALVAALGAWRLPLSAGRRCRRSSSPPSSPTRSRAWSAPPLEQRGLLDNEAVNFLNTLAGALLAAALSVLL